MNRINAISRKHAKDAKSARNRVVCDLSLLRQKRALTAGLRMTWSIVVVPCSLVESERQNQ